MSESQMQSDTLIDFERREYTFGAVARPVYVIGDGPAVILLSEMPGISPQLARFARWLKEASFRVFMPSLFGKDGEVPGVEESINVFRRTCISAEFRALESGGETPVVTWLRELARLAHSECGGRGVGAIGMCFTGNFALNLLIEPATVAAVACHPSLPFEDTSAIALTSTEAATIRKRLENENLTALAYRFEGDRWCTAQRFDAYQSALGPRLICKELPDSAANAVVPPFFKEVVGCPHSVVTVHLIDREGEPTMRARDEIISYFQSALKEEFGTEA